MYVQIYVLLIGLLVIMDTFFGDCKLYTLFLSAKWRTLGLFFRFSLQPS